MRTRTRLLCLSMLVALTAGAASPAGAVQVVFGGKLGYSGTDLVGSNDEGISTRNGAVLGVLMGWEFNRWFALHFEPDITLKGAELDDLSFGDMPTSLSFTYVELPLLAKFKYAMPSGSRGGLFGLVGPSLGVKTRATAQYAGTDNNIQDFVKGVDFGLSLGAGYEIPAAEKGVVSFEVRYVIGLTEVFEDDVPRPEVTGDLKNRALQVSVAWYGDIF